MHGPACIFWANLTPFSLQIDSYWYYKGKHGGVSNWSATPAAFPSGLAALSEETGWKYVAHNRYWDAANVYAKQNGGEYDFVIEAAVNHKAIPNSQAGLDEGLLSLSLSNLLYMENPYSYKKFQ